MSRGKLRPQKHASGFEGKTVPVRDPKKTMQFNHKIIKNLIQSNFCREVKNDITYL